MKGHQMLRKLKNLEEREEGFTLIELLVVVIIIGILAAIAIPVFLNQRQKAFASAAKSDLRNAATQLESKYTESYDYKTFGSDMTGLESSQVDITGALGTSGYCLDATHTGLADQTDKYFYISAVGSAASSKIQGPLASKSCATNATLTLSVD